jgi:hypothetical protein
MPFPDAELATIPPEKLTDYLLCPTHPVGGPKSIWFASLGYTAENADELAADLLGVARSCDDFVAIRSEYGVKYEAVGEIGVPGYKSANVLTVWIVEQNNPPRLITAYPAKAKP